MRIYEKYMQEPLTTSLLNLPDTLLAQRTLAGDQRAFEVIVQRYSTPLFRFICHMLDDHDLACDVLQIVFLRFYTSLPKLDTGSPFKPWLFQVAHNCCVDELRHRRKYAIHFSQLETEEGESSSLNDIPDMRPSPEEMVEFADLQQHLLQAIQSLSPQFRNVVLLRYVSQLSFREIGQALNMPEATAKTYFHRARQRLHERLSPQLQPLAL